MTDELTPDERITEGASQLATIVWRYYDLLKEQGFSDQAAIYLTMEYQKQIMAEALHKDSRTGL